MICFFLLFVESFLLKWSIQFQLRTA